MILSKITITKEMDEQGQMSILWEIDDNMPIIEALGMLELTKHEMLFEED